MKRCPQCRRDYLDDSLLYCLEDGTALVQGSVPSPDEPQTAILHETDPPSEAATKARIHTTDQTNVFPSSVGEVLKSSSFDKRIILIPLMLAVVIVVGFLGYRSFSPSVSRQIESIAVMPFVNESGNSDIEYLSDGMTETLMGSLSEIPNLSVKARSSVFRYKGKETDPRTIGKELSVQAILNGRVVARGDQLTVSLELVDAQTETLIWNSRYDRKLADLISLQTEIARDVSHKLKAKLSGADEQRVAKAYTANPEAYQLFEKGRFYWNRRTVPDLQTAIGLFQQAIAKDPNYALAYAGLSNAYSNLNSDVARPPDTLKNAREAAVKALSLDGDLAEAHAALARVAANENDFAGAIRGYQRAIELNGNYATAHQWYGTLLSELGRHDEGIRELQRALDLDPLSSIINKNYANVLCNARRVDECIVQFKKTIELNPNFPFAHQDLSWAYHTIGRKAESVEELAIYKDLIGEQFAASLIRETFAREGWNGFLRLMTRADQPVRMWPAETAIYFLAIGEKSKAMDLLEMSDPGGQVAWINVDPLFDPLRNEPRFKEWLRKNGIPN